MPDIITIDDNNYRNFINPVVGGEIKVCSSWGMTVPGQNFNATAFEDQVEIPLIPESEWDDIIDQQERDGVTIRQLNQDLGLHCLDQNGTNYCHTEDSDVLTEKGWVSWPDYNWRDSLGTMNPITGHLEFQQPLQKHIYEHDGEVVVSHNRRCNFAVTPDHKMLVAPAHGVASGLEQWETISASEMKWRHYRIPHATTGWIGTTLTEVAIDGGKTYNGDDFVKIISWLVSDGFAGQELSNKGQVGIYCFRKSRYDEVKATLERYGFKETKSKPGDFRTWDNALATWIRQHCYSRPSLHSHNKCVPRIVMELSMSQIELFLRSYGDQSHNRPMTHFFSTSKKCLDDIQELFLRIGRRCTITSPKHSDSNTTHDGLVITRQNPLFELHAAHSKRLTIRASDHLHRERYRGLVYCAGVPNHTLVTRRQNDILISRNCWANGVVQSARGFRLRETGRVIDLSPASVAAPIKNFGNDGGWGEEALQYMLKHGINEVTDWPANAIKRQYYNEENKQKALRHVVLEYVKFETYQQLGSAILSGWSIALGFNWWRHLVNGCGIKKVSHDLLIHNSWGRDWSDDGYGWLTGRKKLFDGVAVGILSMQAI